MSLRYPYSKIHDAFETVGYQLTLADGYLADAVAEGTWANAKSYLNSCITQIINAVGNVRGGYCASPYDWYTVLSFEWTYQQSDGEPYELTWQKICEAWVKNDFEGKEWTIACIDRMRTLMWNEPFNVRWAANPASESS